jgi:hypothetical protein
MHTRGMKNEIEEISDIKPQYFAQKCPVCNGFGTLKYGSLTCHACGGCGYILIPSEDTREQIKTDERFYDTRQK